MRQPIAHKIDQRSLTEIERARSALVVEDLPHAELIAIASGIRDRFSAKALQAQQQALQAEQQSREAAERRTRLIAHGISFLRRELSEVDDLAFFERYTIEQRISSELDLIAGTESPSEIEALINDALDREGLIIDDDDDDE